MRKIEEYEEHARECLKMAAAIKDKKHKKALEKMAVAWILLAEDRRRKLRKISN